MESSRDHKVNRYFFLGIILIFAILLLLSLIQFFTAFLSAVIFYVLSKPSVEWLVKKGGWRKSRAAVLVIIVSFFIILMPITLLVTLLYNKIVHVLTHPADVINTLKHFGDVIKEQTGFEIISSDTLSRVQAYSASLLSAILNQGLGFFSTITMMYFFLYFMIINMNRMEAAIIFYLPFKREKINMFGKELVAQTFSNAVGVPLIAIAQGFLGFVGYSIAGVNEAGFWGVITGFCSIIPIVGGGIVWIPTAIYQVVIGHTWQGLFIILWGFLVLGTIDNIIRFVLAKRMADVHPIITVLGVIMGLKYFGFIGLIFGPLLISYFIILLKIYYVEFQQRVGAKPSKPKQIMPSYMQPFLGVKKTKKS
ncbi:MAG TPA: AI-2E family transporter [Chitinophagaceae bacterium]|jgi:predicted PurR-regulated permease PerM